MRLRSIAAACAVAGVGGLLLPDAAGASGGRYLVQVGKLSDGAATGVDPATILHGLNRNGGAGGTFGVAVTARGESRTFSFVAPYGVTVAGASIWSHTRAAGWPAMGTYSELYSSWGNFNVGGQPGNIDDDRRFSTGGTPRTTTSGTVSATATMQTSGAGAEVPGWYLADKLDLTLEDAHAPTLADVPPVDAPLGSTPGGWHLDAHATLTATVADVGSGVRHLLLREGATVHELPVAPGSPTCRSFDAQLGGDSYTLPVPCPTAQAQRSVAVDLSALGDGTHEVRVGVQDAAGNRTWAPAPSTLRVNLPGGALADPGTPCRNGTHDESGACVKRAPANVVAPSLAGTARAGGTLTVDVGTWTDVEGVAWTYRWQRCGATGDGCVDLPGAEGDALPLDAELAGATVRVVVSATTDGGSATATSEASAQVTLADGTLPAAGGSGGAGGVVDAPVRVEGGAGASGGGGGGGAQGATPAAAEDARPSAPPTIVRVPRPNGERAVHGASLSLSVVGPRRLAYGSEAVLEGALVGPDGTAIGRAELDVVVQRRAVGATGEPWPSVATDELGRFQLALPPGPSRIVTVGYRPDLSDVAFATSASATVAVRAPVRLSVDRRRVRNGEAVRFSGLVGGASEGAAPPAAVQVRTGRRWRTIVEAPIDAAGRIDARYRFERTLRTTRYRFRLVVPEAAAWPFARSVSAPVAVRVLGGPRRWVG